MFFFSLFNTTTDVNVISLSVLFFICRVEIVLPE